MHGFRRLLVAMCLAAGLATPAAAQLQAEANAAVERWIDAVASGEPDRIATVLAPEFQIQRADGSAHQKADYIAGGFARISDVLDIGEAVATRADNVMVVRYILVVTETIDGKPVQKRAPRLTVFRRDGDQWLVSAHANFAALVEQ